MPHIETNIPQNIFCSAIKGEFLRIARSTLYLRDFKHKAKELLELTKQQGSKRGLTNMSVYKTVCVIVFACVRVYLHLSGYISFIFNSIKRLHQKPSRGGYS